MEVEPRIANTVAVAQTTGERGLRVGKMPLHRFFGRPEDREDGRKMRFGVSYSTHSDYRPPKMPIKLAV